MRGIWISALVLAAAAACSPAGQPSGETTSTAGCVTQASAPWQVSEGASLNIAAHGAGENCGASLITLTISTTGGVELWRADYPVEHVMVLAGIQDQAELQTAVASWIGEGADKSTSGTLPDWPAAADAPMSGEFPFYVAEGVTRERYLAARAADAPMLCYVQGMESSVCLIYQNGQITNLGAQSFPG